MPGRFGCTVGGVVGSRENGGRYVVGSRCGSTIPLTIRYISGWCLFLSCGEHGQHASRDTRRTIEPVSDTACPSGVFRIVSSSRPCSAANDGYLGLVNALHISLWRWLPLLWRQDVQRLPGLLDINEPPTAPRQTQKPQDISYPISRNPSPDPFPNTGIHTRSDVLHPPSPILQALHNANTPRALPVLHL